MDTNTDHFNPVTLRVLGSNFKFTSSLHAIGIVPVLIVKGHGSVLALPMSA